MTSQCLFLFAQALVLSVVSVSSQHLENDLHVLLHDIDVNYRNPRPTSSDDDFEVEYDNPPAYLKESQNDGTVTRYWGVPDSSIEVGKLFSLTIPRDTFKGTFGGYKFQNLPSFLSWDGENGILTGVPLEEDIGHHYVDILAMDKSLDEPRAKDTFLISVNQTGSSLREESKCSEDATVLTIVTATGSSNISGLQLARIVLNISEALTIDTKLLTLSLVPKTHDPLSDGSALDVGVGDSHMNDLSWSLGGDLVQCSLAVGCDGKISKGQRAIIDRIQAMEKEGILSKELKIPVLGWHLTKVNTQGRRVRRELDDYDFSGDDEYDYSDYDDHFKRPEGRIIPTLSSPVFPEAAPTGYNGEPAPARPQYVSPVLRPVPMSTPVYIPVKPTVVVEPSPTVTDKYYTHPGGYGDFELESSLLTHPSTMVGFTTPLSTTSTLSPSPTRDRLPLEPTSVPDLGVTTEYEMKNFGPTIEERIPKLAWLAGMVYWMRIPENAFADSEDGNTRDLTLNLRDEKGQVFGDHSWIHFEPIKQEIYALPLERNIGKYDFKLEAIDKGHEAIRDLLKISVRQSKEARNFNHEFTVVLKLEKKREYDFKYDLDWQVKAVQKIAKFFGDENTNNINIRNITLDPVHITWTNISLINSSLRDCPEDELRMISQKLMHNPGSEPTRELKDAFLPEFKLKKIHARYYHPCEGLNEHHHRQETHRISGISLGEEDEMVEAEEPENEKPIFRNQIDHLNVTEGKLFKFKVPSDTCYDLEDGDTRNLRLKLYTTDLSPPPSNSWLQFDETNQEFYGLPLRSDVGKRDYILVCIDVGELKVSESLIVRVLRSPYTSQPHVKFSITINMDYNTLIDDAAMKMELVEKIGRVFGDPDARNVFVESIISGSVVVTWRNTSLTSEDCPNEDIQRLRNIMTNNKGTLNEEFKNSFGRFNVTEGMVIPYGECLAGGSPTYVEEPDIGTPEEKQISPSEEDYLLTFIIPAVIIAVMLLLAALIACCLYRRRRYGKMSMADDRTFVSKGIPIIFAEELDDHRPDNAKSPVIMKEEKPPLPPPEYQKSSPSIGYVASAPSGTPPRMDRRRHASGDAINSADDTPYHPPPPFTASNGGSRNPRPNLPPAYRKPPTYVPP